MNQTFVEQDIRRNVLKSCIPVTAVASQRDLHKRTKQIVQANRHCDEFFAAMRSESPFESEEQAIQSLAPIAIWFIGWAVRQFAIMVIKALWREYSRAKTP
jgi:hypothetical protein